jgi:leader peptidase (prepilin peptidase)/N-methyltransferase
VFIETLFKIVASLFVFVLGSAIGSFLNVVIYRLPAGLSLLNPPSHCPKCLHTLGKSENIPIFGWICLKGRCRWCQTAIASRYPLVEAVTGLLFCLVFWQGQFHFNTQILGYWVLLSWLLALALIDLDTLTLPNILTQSGLVLGLGFQLIQGWQQSQVSNYLMSGIVSAVVGIWLFDIIGWLGTLSLGREALGGGDPKLTALIGAWLGWKSLLVASFLACALGSVVGIVGIGLGLMGRRQAIPFGPFLALGAVLAMFLGDYLLSLYQEVFFPVF